MTSRRLKLAVCTVAMMCACGVLSTPTHARGRWFKLRRQGTDAILSAAQVAVAPTTVALRYTRDVLDEHPDASLTLTVARRPQRSKPAEVVVQVTRGKKHIATLSVSAGQYWVRHGDGAPSTSPEALFQPVEGLDAPLVMWAPLELLKSYRLKMEGEFQGTALFRLYVDYTAGRGWQPMKMGLSKKTLCPTVTEILDAKSAPTVRLLMSRPRETQGMFVAEKLRIRSMKRKQPIDFALSEVRTGAKVRQRWGAKAMPRKQGRR